MLHDDAFTIYLEQISGKPSDERRKKVQEYPHPCSEDGGYTNVRRTLIKVGTVEEITRNHRCAIVVKPPRNFDLLGAEGLKVTVAIGHTQQEPHGLYGVQAWFIPASILFEKEEFEITDCWQWWYRYDFSDADDARKTRNRTPNAHLTEAQCTRDAEWADTYHANKGSIAVWVVRGDLSGETDVNRIRAATDPTEDVKELAKHQMQPISFEWFVDAEGESGTPQIREFCNVGIDLLGHVQSTVTTAEVNDTATNQEEEASEVTGISDLLPGDLISVTEQDAQSRSSGLPADTSKKEMKIACDGLSGGAHPQRLESKVVTTPTADSSVAPECYTFPAMAGSHPGDKPRATFDPTCLPPGRYVAIGDEDGDLFVREDGLAPEIDTATGPSVPISEELTMPTTTHTRPTTPAESPKATPPATSTPCTQSESSPIPCAGDKRKRLSSPDAPRSKHQQNSLVQCDDRLDDIELPPPYSQALEKRSLLPETHVSVTDRSDDSLIVEDGPGRAKDSASKPRLAPVDPTAMPRSHDGAQPGPAEVRALTSASKAGTNGVLHENQHEEKLLKKQLELLKAENKVAQLKKEMEILTRFGGGRKG